MTTPALNDHPTPEIDKYLERRSDRRSAPDALA
jgi:hypothetical protein